VGGWQKRGGSPRDRNAGCSPPELHPQGPAEPHNDLIPTGIDLSSSAVFTEKAFCSAPIGRLGARVSVQGREEGQA